MSFLQPWAAWFLIGIPIIVILYIVRSKRREFTVSTHLFWQRVLNKSGSRALFYRLRNWLSLLLNLLIFALLVAALAKPLLDAASRETASVVIVLDARARMQAIEGDGEKRFDKAAKFARDYVRQANARREFAIVTAANKPIVSSPFSDDQRSLLRNLEQVVPTDAPGDLSAAIEIGHDLLAARSGKKRLIVLTDRMLPSPAAPSDTEVVVHPVGTPRDNLAITALATRRNPMNPQTAEVLLRVQNFGFSSVQTEAELALDGRPFEVKRLSLAPGEQQAHVITTVPKPGRGSRGWLTATLNASDAVDGDNRAHALLPVQPLSRILLVTRGNPFLEKLLAVDPARTFQLIAPDAWRADLTQKFEVVLFDQFIPSGFEWSRTPGSFFFIGVTPFFSQAAVLDRPLITEVDASHPITRNLSLQNVLIQSATPLVPPSLPGVTLAIPLRSQEHPLLIAGSTTSTRFVALGFDVMESDLPLRVAFPLLIGNALQWLEGNDVAFTESLIAGETMHFAKPCNVSLDPVDNPRKPSQMQAASRHFTPLHNGFYRVADSEGDRWIAVNTFSEEEANTRIPPSSGSPPPASAALPGSWAPWQWLALAALALFTGEWWLFHRRKTE